MPIHFQYTFYKMRETSEELRASQAGLASPKVIKGSASRKGSEAMTIPLDIPMCGRAPYLDLTHMPG